MLKPHKLSLCCTVIASVIVIGCLWLEQEHKNNKQDNTAADTLSDDVRLLQAIDASDEDFLSLLGIEESEIAQNETTSESSTEEDTLEAELGKLEEVALLLERREEAIAAFDSRIAALLKELEEVDQENYETDVYEESFPVD